MCQILRRRLEKPNGGGQGAAVLATLSTDVRCASVRGGVHRASMSHNRGALGSAQSTSRHHQLVHARHQFNRRTLRQADGRDHRASASSDRSVEVAQGDDELNSFSQCNWCPPRIASASTSHARLAVVSIDYLRFIAEKAELDATPSLMGDSTNIREPSGRCGHVVLRHGGHTFHPQYRGVASCWSNGQDCQEVAW